MGKSLSVIGWFIIYRDVGFPWISVFPLNTPARDILEIRLIPGRNFRGYMGWALVACSGNDTGSAQHTLVALPPAVYNM